MGFGFLQTAERGRYQNRLIFSKEEERKRRKNAVQFSGYIECVVFSELKLDWPSGSRKNAYRRTV